MPAHMIGDLRQHLLATRHNTALKTELNTLVQEMSTGQKTDLTAHLGAGQTKLSGLDRQLQLLGRFARSNMETAQLLSTMQVALGNVDTHSETASGALLLIDGSSSEPQIANAGLVARAGFEASVQSLNMRSGDRSMFGGTNVDTDPLAPAADMLDAIKLAIAGLTNASDVSAALEDWFNMPGGGFDTVGYQGETTSMIRQPIDADQTVEINIRADDAAIRDTLKAFAMGALAGDASVSLTTDARRALQREAGEEMLSATSSLISVRGRLGYLEERVEDASVRNAAQATSFGIARNTLVSADPYDTATRLQAVQLQLETHYTVTARLSRLSLTEYLR